MCKVLGADGSRRPAQHGSGCLAAAPHDRRNLDFARGARARFAWLEARMSVHNEYFNDEQVGVALDGRYELGVELGRGATGVVREAFDRESLEVVAVKVLHPHLLSSAAARKRFRREARSARLLNHRHSVAVKGHGCAPTGEAYLVMERLCGVTFTSLMSGDRAVPQLRAIGIVAQVLEAAAAAHRMNILHRDLKPNNVMLVERDGDPDFVKVCDFGLAKQLDGDQISSLLTQHGEVCGTPAYMAPEQARGEPLDARADVYAVGVMLFQAVTGRLPFQAASPFAVASMHLSARPPRLRDVRADVSFFPPLESLILRTLSKDRAERPSSAEGFRADLIQVERDYRSCGWDLGSGREPGTLAPAPIARPIRRSTKLLGVAGALVLMMALGLAVARRAASADRAVAAPSGLGPSLVVAPVGAAPSPPLLTAVGTAPRSGGLPDTPPPDRAHPPAARRVGVRASASRPRPRQPGDPNTEPSLAAAEERLTAGRLADACALGQVTAARAPQDPSVWEFLGRCYMRIPDAAQARDYYRRFLALAPADPRAEFIRAIVER
jgi:serine/threonine-protein kinase